MQAFLYELYFGIHWILSHMVIINFLLSIVIIFFQRKEPKSVWAWLLILYSVPIVGFIIYLLAGTDMHKRKMFKTKEIEDKINEAIRNQEYSIQTKEMENDNPDMTGFTDLVYYNLKSSGAVFTDDNALQVFTDGNDKFDALIEDMKQATQFIHMQYYIIRDDVVFNRIKEVLIERAHAGVEVKILFDGMGCRGVSKKLWKQLNQEGIRTVTFFPAILGRLQLRINYRNHRKIVIIDGETAYVGGFNVAKEYVGLDEKFGYWRDTHLRIEGSAVTALQIRFMLDWNYAARENLFSNQNYLKEVTAPKGRCEMQVISSGPDSTLQNIRNNYLRLICKATKTIYIQTPYFIPDEALLNALTIAVYSGVEVNIMIPCKPDHPFVYWATYSYIGDLVMAGANCYTYDNGFLHAKGMIVDSKVLCYGTANMDIRSFQLNFEVNVVIYSEAEAEKMEAVFNKDLTSCSKITKDRYSQRNLLIRIKEQFSRLLSPLL
ncbi:MAG: cardiolipin synthase [Lachnospiraceae bacterium]